MQAASAVYDLFAAGVYAVPILAAWHFRVNVASIHEWTGATGQLAAFEPLHMLFVNMFGWFTIVWSVLRIAWREKPTLVLCDVALRLYFAALMLGYISFAGISAVLYAFVVSEIAWSTALIWVYARRSRPSARPAVV